MTVLVEGDGAIYQVDRADLIQFPRKVWDGIKHEWIPYEGDIPKEIGWADIISDADSKVFMHR